MALLLAAVPALAALPLAEEASPKPADSVTQSIEAEQDTGSDERISARLRGIYAELPAFGAIGVGVREGVVTLSGEVPSAEDIDRAENIAARVSGVVTVENDLERDLSLGENVQTLGSIADRLAGLGAMLPLIGFALLVALVISAIGYAIAGLTGLWRRIAPNSFLAELIASAIRFVFVVGGIVIALDMVGAGALMGAVLGGAGLIGIALGFAMRDTIENYVASLMLSLRQPFRPNDHVVIDTHEGRVIRLTSRATILMTMDGNHLRIPNGQVFRAVILNYTRNPQRRFEFELGIDADDDPTAACRLGRETLENLPFVLADPPPEVHIAKVGESNVVLQFLAWINQDEADWLKARTRAIAAAKAALEEAGFALPEPIYRLRFDERTMPLPLENIGETGRKTPAPRRAATGASATEHALRPEDIRPDDEVARMVVAERSSPGKGQEKDLLDTSRPVE